ncbi:hypothetical protein FHETE_3405 [Fusarium heterosporum]|uniref:Uncharacterized protein n=1 Tax=Fusarium heterosporum TaxID=42747 RepID=A0A8H5TNS9_FUSHE|nr:hypothetical protein FHETE_3405 [Fusarium heterosporum]
MPDHRTIEEMASWLLDDSTFENGEENPSPIKRRATTPRRPLPYECDTAISPLNLPSPVETPPKRSDNYPQNSRVGKISPRRSPGRLPRRAATTRIRRNISQRRTVTNLHRRHGPTRTLSLNPLKFHPINIFEGPTSALLAAVDNNVGNRVVVEPSIHDIRGECAGGENINEKLAAMLAATNTLKPSPQRTNSASSRITRMVPTKVLAKVSNAWDRFHSKSPPHEKGLQDRAPVSDKEGKGFTRGFPALSPSVENMSPISAIELRLNEGDNLNKRKVQRIIGGRVNRKPLADDGKSLRNGKFTEDPFSERGGWRKPNTLETRLTMGPHDSEGGITPLLHNPFESEKGFDNNIEDRFLNSTPVGSSTPRIRVERASTSSSRYSSTPSDSNPPQKRPSINFTGHPPILGKGGLIASSRSKHMFIDPTQGTWIDSVTQTRQAWERAATETDRFGSDRMKKHPSPSKEALERLEVEFRQFTNIQVPTTGKHDLDELATNCTAPSFSWKKYERKRSSLTRLSITNIDELSGSLCSGAHHRRGSSTSMLQLIRSPCAMQNPTKLHKDIRLAVPYRPIGVSPSDMDELH